MIQRSFGDGMHVSVVGVGCGRVGSISNPISMREIEATLEAAVQSGVNLFDTADIYGQGDSERVLSSLLRRHRERVFVVTKIGGRHGRYAGVARFAKPLLRVLARSRPKLRNAVVATRSTTVIHVFSSPNLLRAVGSLATSPGSRSASQEYSCMTRRPKPFASRRFMIFSASYCAAGKPHGSVRLSTRSQRLRRRCRFQPSP